MLRVTFAEASEFLGYNNPWVYNTMPKVGIRVKKLLGAKEMTALIKFSFLARTYESYPFEHIVSKRFLKLVKDNTVAGLATFVHSPDDLHDIVIALKVTKPNIGVFNLISYVYRKVDMFDGMWRQTFKAGIFYRLAKLFIQHKIDISYFVGSHGKLKNKDLQEGIISGFRQELVASGLYDNK